MIGDCGKNKPGEHPTAENRAHRAVGVETVSEDDDRRFRKILRRGRGLSVGDRWRETAECSGDSEGYCAGSGFPSASHEILRNVWG
jgi:hypothetical protein